MSRGSKKDKQLIMAKVSNILDAAGAAATTAAQTETVKSLEDMRNRYDTVHLKAYKKNPQTGKYVLFVELPGQRVDDLRQIGLDSICQDQGGAGDYEVMLKTSDGKEFMFRNIFVGGTVSHQHSKLQREQYPGLQGQFGMGGGQFGQLPMAGGVQQVGPQAYNVDLMQYMNRVPDMMKQAGSEQVQMMRMQMEREQFMASQQRESDRNFMALLLHNRDQQQPQANAEIQALRAELERLRAQQAQDSKLDELKRQIDDQKSTLMLEAFKANSNQDASKNDTMLQFMMMMQKSSEMASQNNLALMKQMMDRPGEDERINSLLGTMVGVSQNQLGMVSQIAQMGLLGGGEDHTVRDAVLGGLEGLTQIAVAAMQARAAGRQQPPTLQAPPAQVQQMPAPAPMGGLPEGQQPPATPEQPEEPEEEEVEPLTDAELQLIGKDKALAKVIAMVQNGEPVSEISARLMNHARSGNKIAIRWLQYPFEIGYQVMKHFDIPANRAEEVANDLVGFLHFLNEGGDPNEWTAETGYQIKQPPRKVVSAASLEGPELGSSTRAPTQGVEYDSTQAPEAQAPAPAEQPAAAPQPDPNAAAAQRNEGVTVHESGTTPPAPAAEPAQPPSPAPQQSTPPPEPGSMEDLKSKGAAGLNAGVQEVEIPDDPAQGRPVQQQQ